MHNYIIPNRYVGDSKMGNWYEQKCLKEHHFRDYLKSKQKGSLLSISQQDRLQYSLQQRQLPPSPDGLLHFGMDLLLANKVTKGVLSFNLNEKIIGDDAYAVTTSLSVEGPCLRNVFRLESLEADTKLAQKAVGYGEKFRIVAEFDSRKLYLQSWPLSPQRGSKISRSQEVSLTEQKTSNSVWLFDHTNAKKRFEQKGSPIHVGEQVLIQHALTAQWLASDANIYLNEFGDEYEVFAKSFLFTNKTQNLEAEKLGHNSVEVGLRDQKDQNCWRIVA